MREIYGLPLNIAQLPGMDNIVFYKNKETLEYWFHADPICKYLGFTDIKNVLCENCDYDECFQEIFDGKPRWFVSEIGIYGLVVAANNDVSKKLKCWLRHEVLPKLRYLPMREIEEKIEILNQKLFGNY